LLMHAVLVLATDDSRLKNHRFYDEEDQSLPPLRGKKMSKPKTERDNVLASRRLKGDRTNDSMEEKAEHLKPWGLTNRTERVQFQIEGHEGPQTYVFGFDTGHGRNRQFRLEERYTDGTVKGQYGYYDAKGKLRTVQYAARPFGGYTERHHERKERNLKN
ncbi:hypothetical protein WN55_02347, partial [Dufourea novaeangliae]